ncbi:MAG: glycoside hydrolase family 99-like domain-containing protein [Limisphaerales bacterium]
MAAQAIAIKVLLCIVLWLALPLESVAQSTNSTKPLTLAFYHPWYGTPWGSAKKFYKWDSFKFPDRYSPEGFKENGERDIASADYPLFGLYDNGDPEIVRWHFRLAKAAGIDGFLCSWWKLSRPHELWDWQVSIFENVLLPIAAEEDFKIAVIDECAHYIKNYDQLVNRAVTHLPRYAKHPGYLKIDGQPVWFIYQVWDDWLKADQAARYVATVEKEVGDVFWIWDKLKVTATSEPPGAKMMSYPGWLDIKSIDAFGTYSYVGHWRDTNAQHIAQLYKGYVDEVRAAGKKVALPAIPGHDNTPVHEQPFIVPRENGQTLKNFLAAMDIARPDIVLICSWNEWLETTQVEPSRGWADPYLYLKTIAAWRGKGWKTPPLPPETSLDPKR